jgi:hypothetical protein
MLKLAFVEQVECYSYTINTIGIANVDKTFIFELLVNSNMVGQRSIGDLIKVQ